MNGIEMDAQRTLLFDTLASYLSYMKRLDEGLIVSQASY